jgi:hypothetical protein
VNDATELKGQKFMAMHFLGGRAIERATDDASAVRQSGYDANMIIVWFVIREDVLVRCRKKQ